MAIEALQGTQQGTAETNQGDTRAPETTAAPPAGDSDRQSLSKAEVDELVKRETERARNAAWADARRHFEQRGQRGTDTNNTKTKSADGTEPPSQEQPDDPIVRLAATVGSLVARIDVLQEKMVGNAAGQFERLAGQHGLNDKQRAILHPMFMSQDPADPSAWFASTVADLGIGNAVGGQAAPAKTAAPTAVGGPNRGGSLDPEGHEDLTRWTPEQVKAIGVREYVKKLESQVHAHNASLGAPRLPAALRQGANGASR